MFITNLPCKSRMNVQLHILESPRSNMINSCSLMFWKSCNYVKKGHEVGIKSWIKLLKISPSVYSKIPWLHEFITQNPRIYRKSPALQSFISHWYLQLSCWKFSLNHLASWWKFGTKSWKRLTFQHLEKFLSLRVLTFQR